MANFQKIAGLHNVGGMTRRDGKRNRGRAVLAMVCALMTVMAAGCGKAEEPVPVDLSSGSMEELKSETDEDSWANDADRKDEENFENDVTEEAGADEKDSAENVTPENAGQGADGETAQNGSQDDKGQAEENGTDAQSAGNEQLEGDVRSVESDSFVICKNDTWIEDGVSYAVAPAPGNEEESDLVTIHMAENCVYQYETVKNSGMNPEDVSSREGSFADVKEGLAVTIKGSWQMDGSFLADSIEMFVFV